MFRTQDSAQTVFQKLRCVRGHSKDHDWETELGGGAANFRGWQGKLYLLGCTFEDNVAEDGVGGGGMAIDGSKNAPNEAHPTASGGPLRVCGGRFEGDIATESGGGATLHGWRADSEHTDPVLVENSLFADNDVTSGDGYGGGLNSALSCRRVASVAS